MEDRFHGPEDQDNLEPGTPRKKRRGADFLSQYLLRRREQSGENIETDDGEETDEKPKKFRRFFKGIFKNMVEKSELHEPSEHSERTKGFSLESLFGFTDDEVPRTQAETTDPEVPPTEVPELSEAQPLPVEVPQTSYTERTEPRFQPVIPDLYPRERAIQEQPAPEPAEKEVVINRGANIVLPVALVGLEYLARKKADRKLDAKFSEKMSKAEQETKRDNEARRELETLVKQNREHLESLKHERGIGQPSIEATKPRVELAPPLPERSPQPAEAKQAVASVERRQETEKPKEVETRTLLKEVAKAAESNVPVERVFERSHEVKDDKNSAVGAASIGSIVASRVAQQSIPSGGSSNPAASNNSGGLPIIGDSSKASLYSHAVKNGFWAAIAIIVLGLIAYLLK